MALTPSLGMHVICTIESTLQMLFLMIIYKNFNDDMQVKTLMRLQKSSSQRDEKLIFYAALFFIHSINARKLSGQPSSI